jgi:hypothetical protein
VGLGVSVHKKDGWRGQFECVRRWHELMQHIGTQRKVGDTQQDHDFVYAFFQNCYHLRDWLLNTRAVPQKALNELFSHNESLKVCRDICNGTKHWRIDRPSVDVAFSIGREYVPTNWPGNRPQLNASWFVVCGSTKYDIFELADKCVLLWESFLRTNNLI